MDCNNEDNEERGVKSVNSEINMDWTPTFRTLTFYFIQIERLDSKNI